MVIFDLLLMTRTKLILLGIFLILNIQSYINFSCIEGYCLIGNTTCECGFLVVEFFVTFIWMYVFACLIVEFAKLIKKQA